MSLFWPIACLALLLGTCYFVLKATICLFLVMFEINPKRKMLVFLFPWALGIVPGTLTTAGDLWRDEFVRCVFIAAALALPTVLIDFLMRPQ